MDSQVCVTWRNALTDKYSPSASGTKENSWSAELAQFRVTKNDSASSEDVMGCIIAKSPGSKLSREGRNSQESERPISGDDAWDETNATYVISSPKSNSRCLTSWYHEGSVIRSFRLTVAE